MNYQPLLGMEEGEEIEARCGVHRPESRCAEDQRHRWQRQQTLLIQQLRFVVAGCQAGACTQRIKDRVACIICVGGTGYVVSQQAIDIDRHTHAASAFSSARRQSECARCVTGASGTI